MTGNSFDALEEGIVEPMVSKLKSLKFATEAAITILRIDSIVEIEDDQKKNRKWNKENEIKWNKENEKIY